MSNANSKKTGLALMAVLVMLWCGCATTRGPSLVVGGMSIRAERQALIGMEDYTDEDVLRLAGEAFDMRLFERAYALYLIHLEEFPGATGEALARFNAALCAERLERFDEAIELFNESLEKTLIEKDRVVIRFRLTECCLGGERWEEARDHIGHLLRRADTALVERFDLRIKLAWIDANTGHQDAAVADLERMTRHYRHDRGATLGGNQGAMAQYYLGEVHRLQAESVVLLHVDDLETARRELNLKAGYILEAQDAYLETIRIGVHDWIPRAGFRLGGLYEQFRTDILDAPYPTGVTSEEDREIYQEILCEQTANLLLKARTVYRKVLDKAAEVNIYDEWIVQIRESLKALESELLEKDLAADI